MSKVQNISSKIYLIPSLLAENTTERSIPSYNFAVIKTLKCFFVENARSARRFISSLKLNINISSLEFYVLDKDTTASELREYLKILEHHKSVGIISEAGLPGVADPGGSLLALAHQRSIEVIPLIGASSIFLALMASGMNGQSFSFVGYLPINKDARQKKIIALEKLSSKQQQTQIFMETPYRNNQLLEDILKYLQPNTRLCIASNITSNAEFIKTKSIKEWKLHRLDLHKKPTIFLIQSS